MSSTKLSLSLVIILGTVLTRAEPPAPNYQFSNYDSPYSQPEEYNAKPQNDQERDRPEYSMVTTQDHHHMEDDAGYPIGGSGSFLPGGSQGGDDYGYTELNPKHPYKGPAHKPMTHSYSPPNHYSPTYNSPPPRPMGGGFRRKPFRMPSLFRLRSKPSYQNSPPSKPYYQDYTPIKPAYSSYGTLPNKPGKYPKSPQGGPGPSQSESSYSYSPKGYKPAPPGFKTGPRQPSYPQHAPSGGSPVSHSPSHYPYGGPTKPSHRPPPKAHSPAKEPAYKGHMPPPPKYSPKVPSGYPYTSYDGTQGPYRGGSSGGAGIREDDELFGRQFCRMTWAESKDYEQERPVEQSYLPQDPYGGGFDMGTSHY